MQAAFRTILVLAATLIVAACARSDPADDLLATAGGPGGGAAAPGTVAEFTANVGDRVHFPVDQTQLTPQARATLDRQAIWLTRYANYAVLIEGHADERGTREYNFALGEQRATNVKAYLVSRGVQPGRIRTTSWGKERPVAVCDNESCWSQNRRAVTTVDPARGS